MASREQIQMDFDRAERQAGELDNIANDLNRISDRELPDMLNRLGSDWKGDNAGQYIQKGVNLSDQMKGTVTSIRQTASTIRTIARNIYEAEMEALRIAEEREAEERARAASNGGGGGGVW